MSLVVWLDPEVIQGILQCNLPWDMPQMKPPFLDAGWETLVSSKTAVKLKLVEEALSLLETVWVLWALNHCVGDRRLKGGGVTEVPGGDLLNTSELTLELAKKTF